MICSIIYLDFCFRFDKGSIVIEVTFDPFYNNFFLFRILKKDKTYKSVKLEVGSSQFKNFVSIYFSRENLVQLLLKEAYDDGEIIILLFNSMKIGRPFHDVYS